MRRFWGWALVLLPVSWFLLLSFDARAERLDPKQAPEPLKAWTSWVLADRADALCPLVQGSAEVVHCAWPTALSLGFGETGGRFEQHWHLDARAWVPLPGDATRWPLDVTEGTQKLVVVEEAGVPRVELAPGEHTLVGAFVWDSLPDSLQVPPETGIVSLLLEGARVGEPRRDVA